MKVKLPIPIRQYHVLGIIEYLGSKATLEEVAKRAERKGNTISRQAVSMEKDGLIKRTQDMPKSTLLRLELTEKGLNMIKFGQREQST